MTWNILCLHNRVLEILPKERLMEYCLSSSLGGWEGLFYACGVARDTRMVSGGWSRRRSRNRLVNHQTTSRNSASILHLHCFQTSLIPIPPSTTRKTLPYKARISHWHTKMRLNQKHNINVLVLFPLHCRHCIAICFASIHSCNFLKLIIYYCTSISAPVQLYMLSPHHFLFVYKSLVEIFPRWKCPAVCCHLPFDCLYSYMHISIDE